MPDTSARSFFPQKFSLDSYLYMWNQRRQIGRPYLTPIGVTAVGIRMALAVIGMLPIVIIYPFLQKYLTKGIVMDAVKG